jgi:hypothetical protein
MGGGRGMKRWTRHIVVAVEVEVIGVVVVVEGGGVAGRGI